MSLLDFKLGIRMLVRYPGLTLVGCLSISVAIGIGAGFFEVMNDIANPELPFEDGDRIVAIENWDVQTGSPDYRSLHAFVTWRDALRSVDAIGAYRALERNLITGQGRAEPVRGAYISASAFRMLSIPPLLGRPLLEADEEEGAAPVVVLGYETWQARFAGDPDIVGETVQLGPTEYTVVGVMPEGFAFPVNQEVWVPLRLDATEFERGQGPSLRVVGRLADTVTLEEAQAELTAMGLRTAAAFPTTNRHLRPRILPYAQSFFGEAPRELYLFEAIFVAVLLVICANVATLMFARAATREGEIAVRNALGASRGRIITQLFAEALVLTSLAAAAGLAAASWVLESVGAMFWMLADGAAPFWWDFGVSPATVLYAAALTMLGAVVVGVVPALKVTGRAVRPRLQRVAAGGSGMRFGGLWTGIIITQVALAVAILPIAVIAGLGVVARRTAELGFPADEYLSVRLELGRADRSIASASSQAEFLARYRATYQELERRLVAEPEVVGVTFADRFPGMDHPVRRIELEGAAPQAGSVDHEVQTAAVAPDFFHNLGAPIVAGRAFDLGDVGSRAGVVIVNQAFARHVLRGPNPIGRRVRYAADSGEEPGPWYEIVGVASGLAMDRMAGSALNPGVPAGLYHPLGRDPSSPGGGYPVRMAVHVRGDAAAFAPRVRAVATAVDPTLRLFDLLPLDGVVDRTNALEWLVNSIAAAVIVLVASITLVLAAAGTYSLMSLTVSRRTREIGIRVALGARPRRIVAAIFRRAFVQLGLGVVAGASLGGWLFLLALSDWGPGNESALEELALILAVATVIMGAGLLACGVPARRALRIEPTEALKDSG